MSWFQRLRQALAKTREAVKDSLDRLTGHAPDPAVLDELEAALISADLGVRVVSRLMERVRMEARGGGTAVQHLQDQLRATILELLRACAGESIERSIAKGPHPYVVLAVGVNGVGKTTTVAKLARRLRQGGITPLLVAADTFRAAAIDQLQVWADRIGVDLIRQRQGADPAAVAFDGLAAAKARGIQAVLIDTAGRLHTKSNLMEELRKIKRVLAQEHPGAPHEVLLVLDATVGQNALSQARQFHAAVGVTGLALTKLDGTARGGIVVAIADELEIPVRLIGVGEAADDLQDFDPQAFVDALFDESASLPGR